jgi:hypothetical protein
MTHQENAPLSVTPGAMRFNTDSMKLEYYRGGPVGFGTTTQTGEWVNLTTDSPDIQTGGTRGVTAGGNGPGGLTSNIQYFNIASTGNTITFGALSAGKSYVNGCASSTRGLFSGGYLSPNVTNVIEYVTISSTGNVLDFGDISQPLWGITASSSSTRAIFAGGTIGPGTASLGVNNIEYATIASTGNAIDFGDLNNEPAMGSAVQSSTRSVIAGGYDDISNSYVNTLQFITISTLGNAADFGDLTSNLALCGSGSNSIRGIFGGGTTPTTQNVIQYITIGTLGNTLDFGDLTQARQALAGASSSTRVVFNGGENGPTAYNILDYVTISSLGNAIDFGDNSPYTIYANCGFSNGHGGLG